MKCPICGETLRPGKKDPNYLLCYSCKKKFKAPQKKKPAGEEQKYSNIPPKAVREKREREMKQAYDDLLSVEDEKSKRKKKKKYEEPKDDDYDDDFEYDEDSGSKLPIIILGAAIIIVACVIAYMLLK
ncbi:hypothetical protein AALA78_13445 [Lachnospiraceae bacterium 42-17]|jgi:hypothetical protein|nr:hypothetical protein [Dorea sp.]